MISYTSRTYTQLYTTINCWVRSVRTAPSQVVYYTVEMVLYTGMPHYNSQLFLQSIIHWTNYDGGSNKRIRLEYKKGISSVSNE